MSKNNFYFLGRGPFSKSLLNRALIIKSWFPNFTIQGSSSSEDILIMKKAIEGLKHKKEFYCGLSGTAFRFLAVRLSREKGDFLLTTDKALLKRPIEEIAKLLPQLSVSVNKTDKGFLISSNGWRLQGDYVNVSTHITSQYASAMLLNSWNLKQDLCFSIGKNPVSYPYFQMTLDFVQSLGCTVHKNGCEFFIPKGQTLKKWDYTPEQDKSCLFALACFAVLKGQSVFVDWEDISLQPDNIFPKILNDMGVSTQFKNKQLIISKCENLKPLKWSCKNSPDLFPLLCLLCAKAEGLSELNHLSHLVFKESNRLDKTKELLNHCKIKMEIQKDKCFIYGKKTWPKSSPFVFDTAYDHRMAMAGKLISYLGIPITVLGQDSVNKSFPDFYSHIGFKK